MFQESIDSGWGAPVRRCGVHAAELVPSSSLMEIKMRILDTCRV